MTRTVGQAVRLIGFVPPRVSLKALGQELGLVPFTVQVALRRLRILLKWKSIRYTDQSSGLWSRRILISRDNLSGKSWDWIRKTKDFAKRRLGCVATGLDRSAIMSDLDINLLRDSASLRFYRGWCGASTTGSRDLQSLIHENDSELKMSNFLRARISPLKMRVLLMARCGGLMFQDRISKFDTSSSVKCSSCSTYANETLFHWLFDCPAYSNLRLELATSWQTDVGTLFRREPLNWAPLRESPQFDEIAESRLARRLESQFSRTCGGYAAPIRRRKSLQVLRH